MPIPHPVFLQPSDETVSVWRYMDFAKFVALLHNKALHFARLDKLEDDFEGSLPTGSVELRRLTYQHMHAKLPELAISAENNHKHFNKNIRSRTYVNCWHMNSHESTAMWESYAKSGAGIAIRSTYQRLRSCLPSEVNIGKISYIDYTKDTVPLNNMYWPVMTKRMSFEHEKEARAVIARWPEGTEDFDSPNNITHLSIKVDLDQLIDAIHVAPRSPTWIEDLARSVVATYGLKKPVSRSGLDSSPLF